MIDESFADGLDALLQTPEPNRPTPLAWFRQSATHNSPKTILAGLSKLKKLQQWQVGDWDLSILNPNRRKQLAQIGFRSTAQALSRMNKERRYPILPVEAIFADMSVPEEYTDWLEKNKEAENYPIISTKIPALFGPGCKGQPE